MKIKFRIWHEKSKKFANWDVAQGMLLGTETVCFTERPDITKFRALEPGEPVPTWYYKDENIFKHPDFELEQFTGLIDKDGLEIYVGDKFDVLSQSYELLSQGNIAEMADILGGDYYFKHHNGVQPIYVNTGNIHGVRFDQ